MRSEFRKLFSAGPAGIKCACCRPGGCHTKKDAQKVFNRRVRRYYGRYIARVLADMEHDIAVVMA
jgi:hypothetical protein